jgi:hypothetical protein
MWGRMSLEYEAHEWAEDVKLMGYADDFDGSDRPGLPAAIAENLPSNETPAEKRWDLPWEIAVAIAGDSDPPAYWFFGPSAYVAHEGVLKRAKAGSN